MAPPRVLIIVENLPLQRDARVKRQCKALLAAGYGVSVICPKGHEELSASLQEVRLHTYPAFPELGTKVGFVLEYAYSFLAALLLTCKALVRERLDVLQVCNPPEIYFILGAVLKRLRKRFVFDHHDLSPELFIARYGRTDGALLRTLFTLERVTIRTADHVIATNDSVKQVAIGRGGKHPDAVTVVRNGPELDRARRRATQPDLRRGRPFLCAWLGVIGDDDGVDLALRAAAFLVHDIGRSDCGFVFMGDGEMMAECQRLATELGLDDYVSFPGWVSQDIAYDHLSTAHLGLAPDPKNARSDSATMMKVMEYLLFALPVVAFDVEETRVSAAEAAVYAPANDVVAYARLIDDLLSDDARRHEMGKLGRRRIEQGLSWDHQKRRYLELMGDLVGRPGS